MLSGEPATAAAARAKAPRLSQTAKMRCTPLAASQSMVRRTRISSGAGVAAPDADAEDDDDEDEDAPPAPAAGMPSSPTRMAPSTPSSFGSAAAGAETSTMTKTLHAADASARAGAWTSPAPLIRVTVCVRTSGRAPMMLRGKRELDHGGRRMGGGDEG
jgi:hypothetical protein